MLSKARVRNSEARILNSTIRYQVCEFLRPLRHMTPLMVGDREQRTKKPKNLLLF